MSRRAAREKCVKILYQIDISNNSVDESMKSVFECDGDVDEGSEQAGFLRELVTGVLENLEAIDAEIKEYTHKWSPDRLGRMEKAILRLAVYEIVHRPDIPVAATINEAVELSKEYASDESARFVNGVLAGIAGKHGESRGKHGD
ncbi:MAG: transcription antitermination factor NusB [Firmicutes bacterium]|nr:transcription antitermination factor NusB [Bacillota bacterium]